MNEWQPIETAPKDGTRIVCWSPGFDGPCFLRWKTNPRIMHAHNAGQNPEMQSAYFGDPEEMDDYHLAISGPTHWMPLPDPPVDQQKLEK